MSYKACRVRTAGSGKVEEMARCSADVIGLDWSVDIARARATLGSERVVQGNVDPMVLFGSEAVITAEVERVLRVAGPTRHIMNVGHGVAQGTPEENVALFCELARRTGSGFGAMRELATV
jgi:uroporphyrinogen-III decarboxylase